MIRIIGIFWLLSSWLHAQIPTNTTILSQCSSGLVNCTTNNSSNSCIETFNKCVAYAQNNTRMPLSCYQADAAKTAFKYAYIVVLSIVGVSIFAPMVPILFQFIGRKYSCCETCFLAPPSKAEPTEAPLPPETAMALMQSITGVTTAKFGMIFSGMLSLASASWLFPFWKDQTYTDAACRFDTYQFLLPPT
ncbi:MAG: hypothetical protein WCK42_04505 [Myxococcaceae bacterium]